MLVAEADHSGPHRVKTGPRKRNTLNADGTETILREARAQGKD
jgi:hypothetical protein